jgi:DNA-binding beta-propeller fold protein YncE
MKQISPWVAGASARLVGLVSGVCAACVVLALSFGATPASAGFTYSFQRELKPASGSFGSLNASSVAVDDGDGDTYVADSASGTIDVFETGTGAQLSSGGSWNGSAATNAPFGVPGGSFGAGQVSVAANNGTGLVYVLDSTDKVVDVLEPNGDFRCQITGKKPVTTTEQDDECNGAAGSETPAGGFATPTGLTVDQATGEVYVLDPENEAVDVFGAGGEYLAARSFSFASIPGGFSGAVNTRSIAVDDFDKDVYVADSGTDVLYEFGESSGKYQYLTTWTGGECQTGSAAGASGSTACTTTPGSFGSGYVSVAADDASGRVYVTVTSGEQGETDAFEASGAYRREFSHSFSEPLGTAVDQANSDVYISNDQHNAVGPPRRRRLQPAGRAGRGHRKPNGTVAARSDVKRSGRPGRPSSDELSLRIRHDQLLWTDRGMLSFI